MTRHPNADDASLTFGMWTMPWTRRYARRLELYAKQCGLQVQHEHDGGWTLRYHAITATGPDEGVRRYHRAVVRWQRLTSGQPASTRKQHQDLFAYLHEEFTP